MFDGTNRLRHGLRASDEAQVIGCAWPFENVQGLLDLIEPNRDSSFAGDLGLRIIIVTGIRLDSLVECANGIGNIALADSRRMDMRVSVWRSKNACELAG